MAEKNKIDDYPNTEIAAFSSNSVVQKSDTEKSYEKSSEPQNPGKSIGEEEGKNSIPFYRLFEFADPIDVALMTVGTVAAVANGTAMLLMTLILGNMINSFGQTKDINQLVHEVSKVSLDYVYLAVGAGAASFFQVTCWVVTGERQAGRIRNLYLKTILRQDIAFFDKETGTGEVVGRMSRDTVLIQDAMGEKVGKFIQLVSSFFSGLLIAFIQGWLLTLIMLSSIPPLAIAAAAMSLVIHKMASRGQTAYSKAGAIVEQTISSIRTVASFTGEEQAIDIYEKSLAAAYKSGVYEGLAVGTGFGAFLFFIFCAYALAVWCSARLILDKGYTGGDIVNIIMAVLTGSLCLGQASPCMTAFASGQAAAFKMFQTIKRKPKIDAYDTNGKILNDIKGDIELRDVYFSYPARPDEQIFTGFSLSIPNGTTAALVGQSGSGKSTVISLIERFYDPQAGEVLIDGINLKEFQLRWIREKIGLVSQEPVLFASTIKDNIAYGRDGASIEEIRTAAKLANAAKFIDNMPEGLDTVVGQHGTQLSGGQKQRVAIARAILKDPRILLLDEATSALDAESEQIVQEALDRIMINRSTITVAHRLSTVRNADMIAVIQKGKIVEKGSHSELLKDPDGAYSQLVNLQEASQEPEQTVNDPDKVEIMHESVRHSSSQRFSLHRSISRGSSGGIGSSRKSFSLSFRLQSGLKTQSTAPNEPDDVLEQEQPKGVPLIRLAHLNKPELPVIIIGCIAAVVNGTILPSFGIFISNMVKSFFEPPPQLKKDTRFWALMFVVIAVVSLLASSARTYFFSIAGCRLIRRIRITSFEKVLKMEMEWFDNPQNSSGTIGARLSMDTAAARSLVGDNLALVVQNASSAVAGLLIAFEANWQLSLIILVMFPLLALNGYAQLMFMKGFSADAKMMYEEASQIANDAVGSIRTVASFCAEDKVMKLYQKKCEGQMRTAIRQGLISGIGFGLSFFLLFSVYGTGFYAGARFVQDGKTTFPKVFQVFFALAMAAIAISQSSSFAPDASKAEASIASVFSILDRKSKIDPTDESGTTLETVQGDIELQHISFRYPTRPDVQVFQDLCLAIKSGKTVALVGESGSGKSTVISLLQRFYIPDSGRITLDGVEIQKLQLKWLRQQMGLVGQEPTLFHDTIRANIAYAKQGNATEAEIQAAAVSANAHNFICNLQQGYETLVGYRGVQLSGGQKQRVAIARAIVKDPKVLLLDEATSALDAESERLVRDALDSFMVNRTTIVVAHRLSTIKDADLIAVIKDGMIVEKGKHEALISKNGVYASLVALHMNTSSH